MTFHTILTGFQGLLFFLSTLLAIRNFVQTFISVSYTLLSSPYTISLFFGSATRYKRYGLPGAASSPATTLSQSISVLLSPTPFLSFRTICEYLSIAKGLYPPSTVIFCDGLWETREKVVYVRCYNCYHFCPTHFPLSI